ncbi:MAG: hypothetical protein QM737_17135 [Ferruginibacter sp.]
MKLINRIFFPAIIAIAFILNGCSKTKPYDPAVAPPQVHFDGAARQTYPVLVDPAPVYNLAVGTTDVSGSDRTITYHITSPTGATEGTHYSIDHSGTLTMPAGKAEATIDIRANFAAYASGRIDTLIVTLSTPSIDTAAFMNTVTLILKSQSGCTEDVVDIVSLLGDYTNTNETFGTSAYGPYTTSISSATATSATTAEIVVENIFDDGWGPIHFLLDWTDVNNRTCVVVPLDPIPGSDAGTINPTYAGQTVMVRVPPLTVSADPGTYSYCDQRLVLRMQLGVTAQGWFPPLYEVIMER